MQIFESHVINLKVFTMAAPWAVILGFLIVIWLFIKSCHYLSISLVSVSASGSKRETEGNVMHMCTIGEIRAAFHAAYMQHQAKMSDSIVICIHPKHAGTELIWST